jgi:hypothetical protein
MPVSSALRALVQLVLFTAVALILALAVVRAA